MNKTKNIIEIRLIGSFCIKNCKGKAITPTTQKACAVVAMLALSLDGTKTRSWLKDKLWSEYSEHRAAANLRQALTEIRKSFGKNYSHVITTNNTYVILNLDYIDIDIDYVKSNYKTVNLSEQLINSDLLEGMDVNDTEFEEWLRIERSSWDQIKDGIERKKYNPDEYNSLQIKGIKNDSAQFRYGIGVLKHVYDTTSNPESFVISELITEMYKNNIKDLAYIPVYDYGAKSQNDEGSLNDLIALLFCCKVYVYGTTLVVIVSLLDSTDHKILFSETRKYSKRKFSVSMPEISYLVNVTSEKTEELIYQNIVRSNKLKISECLAINGIHQMFRLSENQLENARISLMKSLEYNESSQTYSWLAFLNSFFLGQRFCKKNKLIEETRYFMSMAKLKDNSSPISLSINAYLESSLFQNHQLAGEYFKQAIRRNPNHALVWDLYSIYSLFLGNLDDALNASKWACYLGQNSPNLFYYETSLSMIYSLRGENEKTIYYGNKVLSVRPEFNTALRYLVSSYANLDDYENAGLTRSKLLAIEPDFSIDVLKKNNYAIINTEVGGNFIKGLEKVGLATIS